MFDSEHIIRDPELLNSIPMAGQFFLVMHVLFP